MPYFKKQKLLFIHIPKTGGTSLENYLSKKFRTPLNRLSLFGVWNKLSLESVFHHLKYSTIVENFKKLGVRLPVKVITIVRNPYDRIISDLFWLHFINTSTTQSEVYNIIKDYINIPKTDNHNTPQYKFLTINEHLIDVTIFKTETLQDDVKKYGFTDFDLNLNVNKNKVDYLSFLNKDSIDLINSFYDLDFKYFGYNKK